MCNDVVDVWTFKINNFAVYLIDFVLWWCSRSYTQHIFRLLFHINNNIANELCFQMKTNNKNKKKTSVFISIRFYSNYPPKKNATKTNVLLTEFLCLYTIVDCNTFLQWYCLKEISSPYMNKTKWQRKQHLFEFQMIFICSDLIR